MDTLTEASVETGIEILTGDDSRRIQFFGWDADNITAAMPITDVNVYITDDKTGNTVNDRDGVTNTEGITIDQTNRVTFLMDALDNVIVGMQATEDHWVRFEVFYGDRMKTFRFMFTLTEVS